jgi:hypothetical protein
MDDKQAAQLSVLLTVIVALPLGLFGHARPLAVGYIALFSFLGMWLSPYSARTQSLLNTAIYLALAAAMTAPQGFSLSDAPFVMLFFAGPVVAGCYLGRMVFRC